MFARPLDVAVLPADKVRKPTRSTPCLRARTEPVPGGALLRARLPASLTARCWLVNSAAATSGMSDTEGIAPLERAPLPRSAHLMRRCCAGSAQLARVVAHGPRQACGSSWDEELCAGAAAGAVRVVLLARAPSPVGFLRFVRFVRIRALGSRAPPKFENGNKRRRPNSVLLLVAQMSLMST